MAKTEFERIAAVHKALSDETRLRMLNLLLGLGELCVCDIEAGLDITQSKASRHLSLLKQAGLIRDRRAGTWIYYGISDDLNESSTALLEQLRTSFGATREAKRELTRTRRLRRSC